MHPLNGQVSGQEEWAGRLQAAETSARQRLQEQIQQSLQQAAALERLQEGSAAALADTQTQLDSLQRRHAALANEHSAAKSEAATLKVTLSCARLGRYFQYQRTVTCELREASLIGCLAG